jgi:hypothetical protein
MYSEDQLQSGVNNFALTITDGEIFTPQLLKFSYSFVLGESTRPGCFMDVYVTWYYDLHTKTLYLVSCYPSLYRIDENGLTHYLDIPSGADDTSAFLEKYGFTYDECMQKAEDILFGMFIKDYLAAADGQSNFSMDNLGSFEIIDVPTGTE